MFRKEINYVFLCNDSRHAADVIYRYLYRLNYSVSHGDSAFQVVRTGKFQDYSEAVDDLKTRFASFLAVSFINERSRSLVFDIVSSMNDMKCGRCVITPGADRHMLVKVKIKIDQDFEARRESFKAYSEYKDIPVYVSIRVFDERQTLDMFRVSVNTLLGTYMEMYVSDIRYDSSSIEHLKDILSHWTIKTEDSPIDFGEISDESRFVFCPESGMGEFILSPYDSYKLKKNADMHDVMNETRPNNSISVIGISK